jgi:aspartate/methionine/tyrosine aminotransferase
LLKTGQASRIAPFLAMDVAARASAMQAAGHRVLRMEVGQPAQGAPAAAFDAARCAFEDGHALGYTDAAGLLALRERLSRHYLDWYGAAVDPARIVVTTGASGGFPLAWLAALDAGDEVALATPHYPPYVNVLAALGLKPRLVRTGAEAGFQPTIEAVEASGPPPSALLLASPSNPAGTVIAPERLAGLAAWCRAHGVRLVSDEIYHGLVFSGAQATLATDPDAIVVGSFSKYWCMTGWRVGWLVLPEALVRPVERLAQSFSISAPHVSQVAAMAALECGAELDARVAGYGRARAHLLARFESAGLHAAVPAEGAFYVYADVSRWGDSAAFAARLLDEAHVAATPGIDFDPAEGHRFVRFSYCGSEADMHEAAERIGDWLARA